MYKYFSLFVFIPMILFNSLSVTYAKSSRNIDSLNALCKTHGNDIQCILNDPSKLSYAENKDGKYNTVQDISKILDKIRSDKDVYAKEQDESTKKSIEYYKNLQPRMDLENVPTVEEAENRMLKVLGVATNHQSIPIGYNHFDKDLFLDSKYQCCQNLEYPQKLYFFLLCKAMKNPSKFKQVYGESIKKSDGSDIKLFPNFGDVDSSTSELSEDSLEISKHADISTPKLPELSSDSIKSSSVIYPKVSSKIVESYVIIPKMSSGTVGPSPSSMIIPKLSLGSVESYSIIP